MAVEGQKRSESRAVMQSSDAVLCISRNTISMGAHTDGLVVFPILPQRARAPTFRRVGH